MFEPRVLARCDEAVDLVLERWNPVRVVLVDVPGEVDERLLVGLGLNWADVEGRCAHARRASRSSRQAPVKVEAPKSRHYLFLNGALPKRLMNETATLERERSGAAEKRRAPARVKDDATMLKAAANLTRDLNVPDSRIYWADMLGSALLGYAALFAAMVAKPTGVAV